MYSSTRLRAFEVEPSSTIPAADDHALAQRAHQRVVVVVEQRARQRLDRLPAQEVGLVDHVLLLEAPDGEAHGVVVDARLVVRRSPGCPAAPRR